jgi:hypothetical protein
MTTIKTFLILYKALHDMGGVDRLSCKNRINEGHQNYVAETTKEIKMRDFLGCSFGERTIVDFAELDILAIFSKAGADAAVLVVIGIDDGVLGAGVTLNEEKKLLEQHDGGMLQQLATLPDFECPHVTSSLPGAAAAGGRRRAAAPGSGTKRRLQH